MCQKATINKEELLKNLKKTDQEGCPEPCPECTKRQCVCEIMAIAIGRAFFRKWRWKNWMHHPTTAGDSVFDRVIRKANKPRVGVGREEKCAAANK